MNRRGLKKFFRVDIFIVSYTHITMCIPSIVIDTNVLFAALYSRRGASFKLLSLIGEGYFEIALSVPLFIEYKSIIERNRSKIKLSEEKIDDILNYLCLVSKHYEIYYLWRPVLKDPQDDMILELAVRAQCKYIVTIILEILKG
ncbi:putative toxin-antitoxin system toxin component, PIN family [Desulfonauticus submarinus]|uniref:Putative toxin-antitoxin system toxin component, PIN family n=1 Tax=Desulfonauticus submarinus TaxID=206665 RepID=A0A1H0CUX6_9BACT|nr:putative toxin-antitoxin system toxin component, PIN family [Desulfonauticus submarinus]SDN61703.1 putative toxin-antitoxin system toxin component, PIN family [Desulfonauticus submarinus]